MAVRIAFDTLKDEVFLPCIAYWNENHFVVIYRIDKKSIYIADPAFGLVRLTHKEFLSGWHNGKFPNDEVGICLLLEPTPDFYLEESETRKKLGLSFISRYFKPYWRQFVQLALGLFVGTLLQLFIPFLTQAIVDRGINNLDIGFVYLMLIGQLVLLISHASVDFIRGWILMHLNTKVSISIVSDFLAKIMKLPMRFFESRMVGDILTRISDQSRVQSFLTGSSLSLIFSSMNFIAFGIVLFVYSSTVFAIYLTGTLLYSIWISLFLAKRRELDYASFALLAKNQSMLLQLILGMQEIKLTNSGLQKRWQWERIQARMFKINIRGLKLSQYQQVGILLFNQSTNLIITAVAANAVITGNLTFGMMLAIQYIIGQLSNPVEQMLQFIHSSQDARISLERLNEVHQWDDEDSQEANYMLSRPHETITCKDVCFRYGENHEEYILENINFQIPQGKITAVVGPSGSGKTTLIRLLLGFYAPVQGSIFIGDTNLKILNKHEWRKKCGVVMQDGFIFSDTIANNIAVGVENIDLNKLFYALDTANIREYVESLPKGYSTLIGSEGRDLSQGQKQRLLIARAVYRDPEYVFFDEATNSLDARNESLIMKCLKEFAKGRTVVIVAHRLSTVVNADQIIVLDKGRIAEMGNHVKLIENRGIYYDLIRNQLELGS